MDTMEVKDHKVKVDDVEMYYRTAGDKEKPALVFLHGWGARLGKGWFDYFFGTERVIKELAKHFYVVAPELAGLMRSQAPQRPWSLEAYAHALHALLSRLSLENPIIMGQSFGGGVAATYAALYPKSIRLLVLVDATTNKRRENSFYHVRDWLVSLATHLLHSRVTPFLIKKFLIAIALGVPFGFIIRETWKAYIVMGEIHCNAWATNVDYKALPMPLLLIWGNRDTWVTPLEGAKEIHREVKGSKLILVKGGHSILYFKPKRVTDAMIANLDFSL